VIHHEPNNTPCACGCQAQRIGEDVSEKLDYTPGVFTVETAPSWEMGLPAVRNTDPGSGLQP